MAKLKRKVAVPRVGDMPAAPSIYYWWALGWATFVCISYLRYYFQNITFDLGLYFDRLAPEFTLGPNLLTFWSGHSLRMAGTALFFLGAWALGDSLLRGFFPSSENDSTAPLRIPFSSGLGLGVLGYIAFALFALGLAQHGVFLGLYIILCLLGLGKIILVLRISLDSKRDATSPIPQNTLEKIAIAFLFVAMAFAFLGTTLPEISYDALVYHLAVPQTYLKAGRMIDMPYNHYSYLPLFTSMLYSWGLAVDGMYSAKLISYGLGCSVLIGLYRWGKVLKDRTLGLIACSILMGTPFVIYLFWVTNSEFGTALFLLLSLMSVWGWLQDVSKNGRMLYLAGIFGGLALASKLTAAFGACILTLFLAWKCWTKGPAQLRRFVLYCALLALPLVPWLARNYCYNGNPFYPYLAQQLGPKTADLSLLRDWQNETRDASKGIHPFSHMKKLWNDAVRGVMDPAFDHTGPLFVGFFFLIACALKTPWVGALTLFWCLAMLSGLSATYITRLLLGYYVPLTLAIAYAILSARRGARGYAVALLISMSMFGIYHLSGLMLLTSVDGMSFATGRTTQSDYLKKERNWYPNPTYGAYEAMQRLGLKIQDRILSIGESRTFYSPNLTIANAPHDIPVIFAWANASRSPEELYNRLKAQNIAAVIWNRPESSRNDAANYVTPRALSMIGVVFDRYFEKIFEDPVAVAYRRRS